MSYPQTTPPGRFRIVDTGNGPATFTATMPMANMRNPLTGTPSLAALAVLVDHIGGFANHARRPDGHWTVSSELAMEFSPNAQAVLDAEPGIPVRAVARAVGAARTTSLSCAN
jgi:hypothetical protein